jgi:hypothetical protein
LSFIVTQKIAGEPRKEKPERKPQHHRSNPKPLVPERGTNNLYCLSASSTPSLTLYRTLQKNALEANDTASPGNRVPGRSPPEILRESLKESNENPMFIL